MRICIISNTSHPCPPTGLGGEIAIWDLAEALDILGHEVILFATHGSYIPPHGGLVEIPLCDPNPKLELVLYNKYKSILKSSDFVHDFSHTKIFANLLYTEGYKNVVSTFFGFSWYQKAPNILVPSESSKYAAANGLNGFEGTPWHQQIGYTGKSESVRPQHLCTNTNFYLPKYKKEDYLLYFGNLLPYKGVGIAIDLAKSEGFNLIIASGECNNDSYYKDTIKGYDNIKYIQLPDDNQHQYIKRNLIQNAKAFLFPVLYREGFGLVTIESLSCGTPVIAFNNGAMPEIIKHGETGFLCNNIEEMITAIKNIDKIDNKKCRDDAVKRFDRIPIAKQYLEIYNEVINGVSW